MTDSMIPRLIDRNAGLGTSITADSEISTVRPENSTALPAVSIVTAVASTADSRCAEERAAEPHQDEQRVVDAEREREHEREVHRPDRDVEQLGAEVERAGRGHQAEDREHQRQAGGDQRAERQHEDRHRHRPRDHLGLQHRGLVRLVEVRPHAGGAGEVHVDAVAAGSAQGPASGRRRRAPCRWSPGPRRPAPPRCGRRRTPRRHGAAARRR